MNARTLSPRPADDQTRLAMSLLGTGIPLSLLIDLAMTLDSREVYASEPGSADWLEAKAA